MSFVHLRLHTEYSLVDSTIRIKQLLPAVEAGAMPAVAMTDQNNMFGMVKFYRAAMGQGLKPIFGVDVLLEDEQDDTLLYHLILLCQNNTGYRNVTKLISRAYQQGQKLGIPRVQRHWVKESSEGVIALSGGRDGDVGYSLLAGNKEEANKRAQDWSQTFPDRYYIELQRTGRDNEEDYLHAAIDLAIKQGLPVVATNDPRFIKSEEYAAHEARVCIHGGYTLGDKNRPKIYSNQQYLRTADEMIALFSDIPSAIENTLEIAKRCNVTLTLGKNYLPEFPIPEGMTEGEYFCKVSQEGLELRLKEMFDTEADDFAEIRKPFDERLKIELDVINGMGFPGYFLIVADFIQWAKDNDIPVGPGRGSGAGSLVAFALKITDIEPLRYDLLFERFLNPERISMPDFDIDFCMDKRDLVIDYVARTYGRDKVSQIITYGSMAAKAVVRDVGRILSQPYGFVDRIAKLIPFEMKMTLTKALKESPDLKELYDQDDDVKELIDLALSLEGLTRNVGKHAGGVLISPSTLVDFTPLYCEEGGGSVVSQFDKDDVEAVGLVKFDFLGLRNLTIIDWAVKTVNKQRAKKNKEPINISTIPLDDKKAFDLLRAAKTTAVFQLESRGMKELILRLQPDVFEDIIALVALYRPGPLQSGMVDDFVNRKKGLAEVSYPHPALEKILEPTYGVIVYQEQVMQIAQVLAGYSLGGADMLRRAMGKKKAEEMDKQRAIFMQGAIKNNVEEKNATEIFDLMALFAEYGFNKCLTGDTKIYDYNTGEQVTLQEAYKKGISSVVSIDEAGDKIVEGQVVDIMQNGIKLVFKLTTILGKTISATANHPFLALYMVGIDWKPLGQLKVGDYIAVAACIPIPEYKLERRSKIHSRHFKIKQILPNQIKLIGDAEYRWDQIKSIEPVGMEMTYDLEIADVHNFVANDLIVHNSHSAAYALVSYQTIWLKAHYPAAFMAAVLSADMDNTDKVVTFIDDCRQAGLEVIPPDINRSQYRFSTENEGNVVFGLGAIKGAGESALSVILEEREKNGTFKSMADLCERVASRKVTKRILETLIKAGAFDSLGKNRCSLMEYLPEALRMAEQKHRADAVGQVDLFGGSMAVEKDEKLAPDLPEWEERERLRLEKNALGLYLTGHPINEYEDEIKQLRSHKLSDLAEDDGTKKYQKVPVVLAGLVSAIRTQNTEKGKRAFVQLDDKTAYYEIFIFSDVYEEFAHLIQKEEVLVIEGSLNTDFSGNMRLRINTLHDISSARKTFARRLQLSIKKSQTKNGFTERLSELLSQQQETTCPIFIHYETDQATAQIRLGKEINAPLTENILKALRQELDPNSVRICY